MIDADDDLVNLVVGFLVSGGRLQEPFENQQTLFYGKRAQHWFFHAFSRS